MKRFFVIIGILGSLLTGHFFVLDKLDQTDIAKHQKKTNPLVGKLKLPPKHLINYLSGTLLGGGKQILLNYLWVQYHRLKQEGRHQQAIQQMELIANFQPHRVMGWYFLGWDTAYNLSHLQKDQEVQWEIIQQALGYLREGTNLNPNAVKLYFRRSRIYGHRIPQNPYFVQQVENKSREKTGEVVTPYKKAFELLLEARDIAEEQGEETLSTFRDRRYGFIVTYMFYDLMRLVQIGKHKMALSRIPEYKTINKDLIRETRNREPWVPSTYQQRLESYEDLPSLIKADQEVHNLKPGSTTREKYISSVLDLSQKYSEFFWEYPSALSRKAIERIFQVLFRLLSFANHDLRKFQQTGNKKYRKRASNVWKKVQSRLKKLTNPKYNTDDGFVSRAESQLGELWEKLNEFHSTIHQLQTLQKKGNLSRSKHQDLLSTLEDVYVSLVEIKEAKHHGFHQEFLNRNIKTLEKTLQIEQ